MGVDRPELLNERSFSTSRMTRDSRAGARASDVCGAEPREGPIDTVATHRLSRARDGFATSRTMDEDVVVVKPAYADAYADAVKRARAMMSELEDDPSTSGGASWTWREGADAAADVIDGCGAHYTAWWFRWTCARGMLREATTVEARLEILGAELDFVERETRRNAKNYQVWNHARSTLSAAMDDGCFEAARARAYEHVERALEEDAKNIHARAILGAMSSRTRVDCWKRIE